MRYKTSMKSRKRFAIWMLVSAALATAADLYQHDGHLRMMEPGDNYWAGYGLR